MAGRGSGRGRSGTNAAAGGDRAAVPGRGRGRGSGSSPTLLPRAPATLADVVSEIQKMRCYGDQPLPSGLLDKCVSFTRGSGKEDQLAQAIFDAVYDNRDRAEPLAILSSQLSSEDGKAIGKSFRSAIISQCQSQYKQRKELRLKSVEVWLSMVSFLSYVFKHLRAGGQPLKPLSTALSTCFSEILSADDVDDNEIDCACDLIRNVGSVVAQSSPEQDIQIARLLREKALAPSTSERARCLLMELVEFRAAGWSGREDANKFYADTSADMH